MCRGTRTCSGPLGSQGGGGRAGLAEERSGDHEAPGTSPSSRPRCTGPAGRGRGPVAQRPSSLNAQSSGWEEKRRPCRWTRRGQEGGSLGAGARGPSPRVCCRLPSPAAHPPCDSLEPWPRGRGESPFGPSPQSRGPRAPLGTQRTLGWPVDRAVPCLSTVTSCLQNSSVRTGECDEAVVLLPEVLFPPSSRSPRRAAALTCRAPTVALGAR